MLHGRRPHQNKAHARTPRPPKSRLAIRLINRGLQWRYARILALTSVVLTAAFAVPAWHFIRENYELFTRIAYDTHPGLVSHLEREQIWIGMLLLLGTSAAGFITMLTTLRMTTVLLGPLNSMERHMRQIIRGDWSSHEFRVRETDEMREVTGTYSYLYRTLRAQADAEMKLLEKITVDPREVESARAWMTLMNLKRKQLGLSEIESAEDSASSQDSRRAS